MSQAAPFVVFYVSSLCLGVGLLVRQRLSPRVPESARIAAQAAARTATFEAVRLWPGLAVSLLLTAGALVVFADQPAAHLEASLAGALAGALIPGASAWLLGRRGLDLAWTQMNLDSQAHDTRRLAEGILGQTLVAHSVGAMVGLLPTLFVPLSGARIAIGLGAALVLLHAAGLSSNAEAVALVDFPRRGRTLLSLASAAAVGILRPTRASLLISTVSLMVHLELGPSLNSSMPDVRNAGTYLMVVQAVAILSLALGVLSIRKGRHEPNISPWIRAAGGATALSCAGVWLARGVSNTSPPLGAIANASVIALLVLSLASALPLLIARFHKVVPFAQSVAIALLAIGLLRVETESTGTPGVQLAHLTLLGVSAALFPLAMALASAADAPVTSKHLGYLTLDTSDAEMLAQDDSLADAKLATLPLLLGVVVGAGLRSPPVSELGPLLAPAILLGSALVAFALFLHAQFLDSGQEASLMALEHEGPLDSTSTPAFAVGVELSLTNVRRATAPLLALGCLVIASAGAYWASANHLVGICLFGLWIGSLATCSLMFLLPKTVTRSALGPLAFSLVILGTTALTIAPSRP
jgi:hypothetical protein